MALYQANQVAKVWKSFVNGVLSQDIGAFKAGDKAYGEPAGKTADNQGVLRFGGTYSKAVWFDLIADTNPPPTMPPDNPPPSQAGRLWEVKGDEELEYRGLDFFNYKSRTKMAGWKYGAITPSVFRFDNIPTQKPTERRVDITAQDKALRALNGNNAARISRLYSSGTALFNRTGFPMLQYLVMSGCKLQEIEVVQNCLKFRTLLPSSSTAGMTIATHPQYVMRWDLVTYRNNKTLHVIDRKGEIYWYLTTNEGFGYIPLEWVKLV